MKLHLLVRALYLSLILGLIAPGPAWAQAGADPDAGGPSLADRDALEAFVDGLMAAQMDQYLVPGAVVSIVHNGDLALAKGYGYADLDTLTRVDADATLFRIGSVSKLFTWTAVMQLVEAGALDLDADVNTYLAGTLVRVPETYPSPVTMYHLMAHTPGFEDRILGLFARDESGLAPLDTLLMDLPSRVHPPGQQSAYTNYGSALAARVVEEISGLPWADYVESRILEPLRMERTTVRQPVPVALLPDLAKGYSYAGGRQHEETFEFVPLAPAGAISATATDMARFMLAHLQLGRLDNVQILDEATARQMQTQHFTHHPLLPGMAHGFIEYNAQGDRWFGHSGDTLWFHSGLYLASHHNVGIFISYNGAGGAQARAEFFRAFKGHYFDTDDDIVPTPPTTTTQQLAPFAGDYRTNRIAMTTPEKIGGLFMSLNVGLDPEGYLVLSGLAPQASLYTEIGPSRFREVNANGTLGREEIIFELDGETARPVLLYYSAIPVMAFTRLAWFERPLFHGALFGSAILLFLGAVIAWPIQLWQDRRRRRPRGAKIARWLGWAVSLTLLVYLIGTVVAFSDPIEAVFDIPPLFNTIGWLPLLSIAPVIAMWVLAGLAWQAGYWKLWGRIFYSLVALMAATCLWQLWFWNLLQAPLIL